MLINMLLVGFGGGIGGFLRVFLSDCIKRVWHGDFPLATFLINITGSFLLGLFFRNHLDESWLLFLGTGVMGGYTTFSTLTYEAVSLIKSGKRKTFLLYYVMSAICGLGAAALGFIIHD